MDLMNLPSILRRWLWLIVSVVAVTGGALTFRLWTTPVHYDSEVRVQVTAPGPDDVVLFSPGNRSSSNLRDDLVLARNNFLLAARSREVYDRTTKQLGLAGPEADYTVDLRPLRDSDFIDLVVSAQTPELAQSLANAHAVQAIRYYGELRAKPATATQALLAEQLVTTAERLRVSNDARNGDSPAGGAAVAEARAEAAAQAREEYQILLKKYSEAGLLKESALRAPNLQVVESAVAPTRPAGVRKLAALLGLALVGSLGLGVLLALLLDAIVRRVGPGLIRSRREACMDGRAEQPTSQGTVIHNPQGNGAQIGSRSRQLLPSLDFESVLRVGRERHEFDGAAADPHDAPGLLDADRGQTPAAAGRLASDQC
jgi:uncharacterized protein involved in exopolysaccharide biosynthesis